MNSLKKALMTLIGVSVLAVPVAKAGYFMEPGSRSADVVVVKRPVYYNASPYSIYSPYRHHYRYYGRSYPYYGPYYHFYPRYRAHDNTFTMTVTGATFPRYFWRRASFGRVPMGAVVSSGHLGRPAYKCKSHYQRSVRYGRVGGRGCVVGYKDRWVVLRHYKVMIRR